MDSFFLLLYIYVFIKRFYSKGVGRMERRKKNVCTYGFFQRSIDRRLLGLYSIRKCDTRNDRNKNRIIITINVNADFSTCIVKSPEKKACGPCVCRVRPELFVVFVCFIFSQNITYYSSDTVSCSSPRLTTPPLSLYG